MTRAVIALLVLAPGLLPRGAARAEPAPIPDPYGVATDRAAPAESLRELVTWLGAFPAHHPAVAAAGARVDVAEARVESARGGFDLGLTAKGGADAIGKYLEGFGVIGVEQATTLWGLRVAGGWRQGADWPIYKGDFVTAEGGEFFLEAVLPLWRDRDIDSRRYKLAAAALKRDGESIRFRLKSIEAVAKGLTTYWKVVQRAWELDVARRLENLAVVRQTQLEGRVASGALPTIARVDNDRLLLARRARVAKARASLAKAEAELAAHRLGPDAPLVLPAAGPIALPSISAPSAETRERLLEEALASRPDLALIGQIRQTLALDLRMAENALGPKLDLRVFASQDVGRKRPIGLGIDAAVETEVGLGLEFALPVQQRAARGEIAALSAEMTALDLDETFLRNQIEATLLGMFAELEALLDTVELERGAYLAAVRLEEAERRAFELGQSTLVVVNIREESTAEAALKLVAARTGALGAAAAIQAFIGRIPEPLGL